MTTCVDEYGNKRWLNAAGQAHREDGPAIEWEDGANFWYRNGRLHREDGPAVEYANGDTVWWYKGILAGKGGKPDPTLWARLTAVEFNGGPLLNGCVVELSGLKSWYKDDKLHREDGPAVEYAEGSNEWYFNGNYLDSNEEGFWELWDLLTKEQRGSPTLLKYLPR